MDRYSSLRNGLVGAWCPSLQAGGGRLIDRSPYGSHPSLTGFTWSGIHTGAAIQGNGTSSIASVGDSPRFRLTTATITGWIRLPAQGTSIRAIFCSYSQNTNVAGIALGVNIGNTSQNALAVVLGNNSSNFGIWQTSVNVCDNVLRSFACVIQGTAAQFYINGVAATTTNGFQNVAPGYAAANYVNIGTEQTSPTAFGKRWIGLLDDLRVYDRALTLAEIRLLASQRGIGLVPTRHRRGSLLSQFWLNVSGTWKTAKPWINVGGTWKVGSPKIRAGGAWKG